MTGFGGGKVELIDEQTLLNRRNWIFRKHEDTISLELRTQSMIAKLHGVQANISKLISLLSTPAGLTLTSTKESVGKSDKPTVVMKMKDLCNIHRGQSKYKKSYFKGHPGQFPVYSSQTVKDGVIARIDSADFVNKTGITWTTDGIHAGTVFKRENESFSLTTHCGFLEIKQEHTQNILLDFLFLWGVFNWKKEAIGDQNKRLTESNMEELDVPFYADIPSQQGYIEKYTGIYSLLSSTGAMIAELSNITSNEI